MTSNVFIVDDHPVYRAGLKALIEGEKGLSWVGESDGAPRVVEAVQNLKPDIVLLDLNLQKGSGMQLIKAIRTQNKDVKILVASMHSDLIYAERVVRLGANGYINKEQSTRTMLDAIWRVLEGKIYVNSMVMELLLQRQLTGQCELGEEPADLLSNRELEIFTKIGSGVNSKNIAEQLNVSIKTVDSHREHIKRKLGLSDSNSLMLRAVSWVNRE